MTVVITFGSYDLFHIGHLRLLQRAKTFGDRLVVGVSSDSLHFAKKKRVACYSQKERLAIVGSIGVVDKVFLEESLEEKQKYIVEHDAHVLVMGDDWAGRFDQLCEHCKVVYLPRTLKISTTEIIWAIPRLYREYLIEGATLLQHGIQGDPPLSGHENSNVAPPKKNCTEETKR